MGASVTLQGKFKTVRFASAESTYDGLHYFLVDVKENGGRSSRYHAHKECTAKEANEMFLRHATKMAKAGMAVVE